MDLERLERDMSTGLLQLLALATVARAGPIHGYGLIKQMDEAVGRPGWWKEGTIYPLLGNLERQGMLESRWGEGPGARRKDYQITTNGRAVLAAATTRWHRLRDAVDAALEEA